jgi:large subunit ribosomal protein L10
MPLTRSQKEARVEELAKQFEGKSVVILSDFTGMDVETATEIRKRFREASVEYRVVKNTLAIRAAEKVGFGDLVGSLSGPNGVVLADGDPVAPAKILVEFEKKNNTPKIRAGWIDATLMTAAEIRRIADLPTREVLLAQIAAGFQAPVAGLARLLSELARKLVSTLDEIGKQKGAESGA